MNGMVKADASRTAISSNGQIRGRTTASAVDTGSTLDDSTIAVDMQRFPLNPTRYRRDRQSRNPILQPGFIRRTDFPKPQPRGSSAHRCHRDLQFLASLAHSSY
jgi:hypothetical protein